jgi:hypothetical protein
VGLVVDGIGQERQILPLVDGREGCRPRDAQCSRIRAESAHDCAANVAQTLRASCETQRDGRDDDRGGGSSDADYLVEMIDRLIAQPVRDSQQQQEAGEHTRDEGN